MKDSELIKRIQGGEKELFTDLIELYYHDIFQFCYYKTGREDIAYDCTQDTFLNLIRYFDTYIEKNKFKSYLYTIAQNTCNDYFRKNLNSNYNENEDILAAIPISDKNLEQIETKDMVQKALNQLPSMQKDVIILHYYYDFKIREIAKIVNAKIPTIKSRLKQGLEKLKKFLESEM